MHRYCHGSGNAIDASNLASQIGLHRLLAVRLSGGLPRTVTESALSHRELYDLALAE